MARGYPTLLAIAYGFQAISQLNSRVAYKRKSLQATIFCREMLECHQVWTTMELEMVPRDGKFQVPLQAPLLCQQYFYSLHLLHSRYLRYVFTYSFSFLLE